MNKVFEPRHSPSKGSDQPRADLILPPSPRPEDICECQDLSGSVRVRWDECFQTSSVRKAGKVSEDTVSPRVVHHSEPCTTVLEGREVEELLHQIRKCDCPTALLEPKCSGLKETEIEVPKKDELPMTDASKVKPKDETKDRNVNEAQGKVQHTAPTSEQTTEQAEQVKTAVRKRRLEPGKSSAEHEITKRFVEALDLYLEMLHGGVKEGTVTPIDTSMTLLEMVHARQDLLSEIPLSRVHYMAKNPLLMKYARCLLDGTQVIETAEKLLQVAESRVQMAKEMQYVLFLCSYQHKGTQKQVQYRKLEKLLNDAIPSPEKLRQHETNRLLKALTRGDWETGKLLYEQSETLEPLELNMVCLVAAENQDWSIFLDCAARGANLTAASDTESVSPKHKRIVDKEKTSSWSTSGSNARMSWKAVSPIHTAVRTGGVPLDKLAAVVTIDKQFTNAVDFSGDPLLHAAVQGMNPKTVAFLCRHGAEVNAKDSAGKTALHYLMREATKRITARGTESGPLLPKQGTDAAGTEKQTSEDVLTKPLTEEDNKPQASNTLITEEDKKPQASNTLITEEDKKPQASNTLITEEDNKPQASNTLITEEDKTLEETFEDIRWNNSMLSKAKLSRIVTLMVTLVTEAEKSGQSIDWPPGENGWSALHILCAAGDYPHLKKFVRCGANPYDLQEGNTLIDTVVWQPTLSVDEQMKILKVLFNDLKILDFQADMARSRLEADQHGMSHTRSGLPANMPIPADVSSTRTCDVTERDTPDESQPLSDQSVSVLKDVWKCPCGRLGHDNDGPTTSDSEAEQKYIEEVVNKLNIVMLRNSPLLSSFMKHVIYGEVQMVYQLTDMLLDDAECPAVTAREVLDILKTFKRDSEMCYDRLVQVLHGVSNLKKTIAEAFRTGDYDAVMTLYNRPDAVLSRRELTIVMLVAAETGEEDAFFDCLQRGGSLTGICSPDLPGEKANVASGKADSAGEKNDSGGGKTVSSDGKADSVDEKARFADGESADGKTDFSKGKVVPAPGKADSVDRKSDSTYGKTDSAKDKDDSENEVADSADGKAGSEDGKADSVDEKARFADGKTVSTEGIGDSADGKTDSAKEKVVPATGKSDSTDRKTDSANDKDESENAIAVSADEKAGSEDGKAGSEDGKADAGKLEEDAPSSTGGSEKPGGTAEPSPSADRPQTENVNSARETEQGEFLRKWMGDGGQCIPSPLHRAVRSDNFSLSRLVNIEAASVDENVHGLLRCVALGAPTDTRLENIQILISRGADINAKDSKGQSVLQDVIEAKRSELMVKMVREAVARGQTVNWLPAPNTWTALHLLAAVGAFKDIPFFVQHGADPTALRRRLRKESSSSIEDKAEKLSRKPVIRDPRHKRLCPDEVIDGLTLIDTVVLQHNLPSDLRIGTMEVLLQQLRLGPYHAQVVDRRPAGMYHEHVTACDKFYRYPLEHLLRPSMVSRHTADTHLQLVRLMVERGAVGITESRFVWERMHAVKDYAFSPVLTDYLMKGLKPRVERSS